MYHVRLARLALFITFVTALGFLAAEVANAEGRPSILFCIADDWGWPHAGAYGDPVVKTPTFDSLAREGELLENAFVTAMWQQPSAPWKRLGNSTTRSSS